MLTDQELQSLRNLGNEAEAAADEIVRLRALLAEWRDMGYSDDRDMRTDAALGREPSELELQYRMSRGLLRARRA